MDACQRKQFKLATARRGVDGGGGSVIPLALAVLAAAVVAVALWRLVVRPALRARFLRPKFLGHYRLYPATGCWARMDEKEPRKPEAQQAPAADPYSGAPFDSGGVGPAAATDGEWAAVAAPVVPELPEGECQGLDSVPPAMVPLKDEGGLPVVAPDDAQGDELWEGLGMAPEQRVVGVHRHDGAVALYGPAPGMQWDAYGAADAPTEQTVAVFALPAHHWWHGLLA